MPCLVGGQFIGNGRARTDQRHFALQHIDELRKLVETGSPQDLAHACNSFIVGKLIYISAVSFGAVSPALLAISRVTKSLCTLLSLFTNMERNLRKVKV